MAAWLANDACASCVTSGGTTVHRFPLSSFLGLYRPHPGPPPLGAGVAYAGRVMSAPEVHAPSVCRPAPTPARPAGGGSRQWGAVAAVVGWFRVRHPTGCAGGVRSQRMPTRPHPGPPRWGRESPVGVAVAAVVGRLSAPEVCVPRVRVSFAHGMYRSGPG